MKRPVDFTLLSNIAASLGMQASWGRQHCPEVAVMPSVTVAPATRRGKRSFILYLHTGARPDRETERRIICDLETKMGEHRIAYEALGCEYQGGTAFHVYAIEE